MSSALTEHECSCEHCRRERLHRAAPDMLAALQRAYSFILCNGFDAKDQKLLNDIAAVIRKAESGGGS